MLSGSKINRVCSNKIGWRTLILVALTSVIVACGSKPHEEEQPHAHHHDGKHAHTHTHAEPVAAKGAPANYMLDFSAFNDAALIKKPEVVSCTLENGVQTECAKFVTKYVPDNIEIGPFCPSTLEDEGGIWYWDGDEAGLYRVNEAYFRMLEKQGYTFFDENGQVHISGMDQKRPEHEHSCISMSTDSDVEITSLIPLHPMMADQPTRLGVVSKVGLALAGIPIFSDAPSVLHTGHMPALDTCGGHVDPGGWYHYHGTATDIETVYETENVQADCNQPQNSSALFGYAFDGFGIYGSLEENGKEPTDLDACGGHVGYVPGKTEKVYHYHASKDFPNLPKCLAGVVAKNNFTTTAKAGVGAQNEGRREPPGGGGDRGGDRRGGGPSGAGGPGQMGGTPPGFDEAAAKLGISTDELLKAMEAAGGPRADLNEVAKTLGVTLEALEAALPPKPNQ